MTNSPLASLDSTIARIAGRVTLGQIEAGTFCAYSQRNVVAAVATEIERRIGAAVSHPSPTEAPGRSDLPALRAMADRAARVLDMLSGFCPAV